jgi:urease accessory protein
MRRAFAVHSRGTWPEAEAIDAVTFTYLDRHRRRIRLVGDAGAAFLLDLPRAHHLADGDGLELDEGGFVRVCAAPEPVLEIAADDQRSLLRLAWHLGNRHLPVQVAGDGLRIRADPVIAGLVTGLGGRLTPIEAAFDPEADAEPA